MCITHTMLHWVNYNLIVNFLLYKQKLAQNWCARLTSSGVLNFQTAAAHPVAHMHLNVINNNTFVRIRFSIISSTSCKRRIRIFLEMSPQNRGPMSKQVWHNKRSLSAPNLQHFRSNGDVTILETKLSSVT